MNLRNEHYNRAMAVAGGLILSLSPLVATAFNSGSTGADGAFSPTVSQEIILPPDGIFNFTDVDIPSGVVITFRRNTTNTPVTILASGDVTVAGEIELSGSRAALAGTAGDGNLGDDGIPGLGGPGGFDGGRGGAPSTRGGAGLGPGAGNSNDPPRGGAGGGFGTVGGNGRFAGGAGPTYGSTTLLPLIGGSGGGGGSGGANFGGSGGGGGAGAILIAASGEVAVTGTIRANGGRGGESNGSGGGAAGGSGSGGGIRIVATTISGGGTIEARSAGGIGGTGGNNGGAGGNGRIRLESENFTYSRSTVPAFTFGAPGEVFVAGIPTLRITSVAGVPAPAEPTGDADITLATSEPNPVTVEFATTSVPVGNTITLTVTPPDDGPTVAISDALSGSQASATASVAVDIPEGPSVLSATLSFTVTASLGDALRQFAEGERVERVMLAAAPGGDSVTTFITASGRRFSYPAGG